jgi:hypothetical protein
MTALVWCGCNFLYLALGVLYKVGVLIKQGAGRIFKHRRDQGIVQENENCDKVTDEQAWRDMINT